MEVEHTWMHGDHLIFKFQGVDTISDAEKLAGAEVADSVRTARRARRKTKYYQSDLIGCEVVDADGPLARHGRPTWQETGGTPLVEVRRLTARIC